jgi:predicted metalloprotease
MRWEGRRESQNVEDLRGVRPAGMMVGGGLGTLVILLIAMFLGADPRFLLRLLQPGGPAQRPQAGAPANPEQEELARFSRVVLADTEDVWGALFPERFGREYEPPILVFYDGYVETRGCGNASSAVGPFYCPLDRKVYIDLSFYDEMKRRFGASGDFAQAYVLAHEVGHHVQNLLGISDRVQRLRQRGSEAEANALSVRLELQADYLAGVWAHYAQEMKDILERGDIDEALNCAAAIGDDRLQREAQGYTVPESFTHGTSEQRQRAFRRGFETGDLNQLESFFTSRRL